MMEKRGFLILILTFILIVVHINLISSLGIVPAKVTANFKPGFETTINYSISGASKVTKNVDLYVEGELAEYINLSETILDPREKNHFTATVKLPDELEPGPNTAYVAVREEIDEELLGGAVGTAVVIRGVIKVLVPYPGKYLEISLKGHDANIGESIKFELGIISRGDENVIMDPRIEIYSENGELVDMLYFKQREIKSQERIDLQKDLDTTGYLSGNYYAIAKVEYDNGRLITEAESDFKIGKLHVNVLNYSQRIPIGGLQKFWMIIESGWNNRIDGAYAEIIIMNGSRKVTEFRTSPVNIDPWESKTLVGYIDSELFSEGVYGGESTVVYYGRDRGKTTNQSIQIEFYKPESNVLFYLFVVGIPATLILIMAVLFILTKKDGKKTKK
jgi:hypothetical protein